MKNSAVKRAKRYDDNLRHGEIAKPAFKCIINLKNIKGKAALHKHQATKRHESTKTKISISFEIETLYRNRTIALSIQVAITLTSATLLNM